MKKISKILLSIAVSALLLYFFAKFIDPENLRISFFRADWRWIGVAFLIYIVVNILRALRFQTLLDKKITLGKVFSVTLLHNFITTVLPFRLGEFSYVYLIKKEGLDGFSSGLGTLVIARILDVIVVTFLFTLSLLFLTNYHLSGFAAGFFAVFLFLILFASHFILEKASLWVGKLGSRFVFFAGLSQKLSELKSVFKNNINRKKFFFIFLLSIFVWILGFSVEIFLFRSIGIKLGFFEIVFALSLPLVASEISPIQAFANFGIFEWSLLGGLVILGVERTIAVQSALILHLQEIIFVSILFLFGLVLYYLVPKINVFKQ